MAELGMNIGSDDSYPAEDVAESGARWVRLVAMPELDMTDYIGQCHDKGMKVLLTIAVQSVPGARKNELGDFEAAADVYAQRYGGAGLIDALQVGNEPDGDPENGSWVLNVDQVNELLTRFRASFQDAFIVGPGMTSGNPDRFDGVNLSLLNAIAVHPYGQGVPEPVFASPFGLDGHVGNLLENYSRFNAPIWITEWGARDEDLEEAGVAEYIGHMIPCLRDRIDVQVAFLFCWSDRMVPHFGLLRDDGSRKPSFERWIAATGGH